MENSDAKPSVAAYLSFNFPNRGVDTPSYFSLHSTADGGWSISSEPPAKSSSHVHGRQEHGAVPCCCCCPVTRAERHGGCKDVSPRQPSLSVDTFVNANGRGSGLSSTISSSSNETLHIPLRVKLPVSLRPLFFRVVLTVKSIQSHGCCRDNLTKR